MKNLLLFSLFTVVLSPAIAQNSDPSETVSDTVSFVSNPVDSLCNGIFKTEGCTPGAAYEDAENQYSTAPRELVAAAWSYSSGSCPVGYTRFMLNFNGLDSIPQDAVITKAELILHGWSKPSMTITVGNSYYPGSPYNGSGTNEMMIKKIATPFHYPTVTWNTQPATDTTIVFTRPSQKQYDDDLVVDVKSLVQDMATKQEFYGFMFMMTTEALYRSFGFSSCFVEDPEKRPRINITYTTPSVGVGIHDVINAAYVELYPQPATDAVNVDYVANRPVEVIYQVLDMRGSVLVRGSGNAQPGNNRLTLQTAHLPAGVYIFTLSDGNKVIRKRLVKQ